MRKGILVGVFLILGFLVSSCSVIKNIPKPDSEVRIHPLGMPVYNMSKEEMRQWDWDMRFYAIEGAFNTLKHCMGEEAKDLGELIRQVQIVVTPAESIRILFKKRGGFTDLQRLFLRSDRFYMRYLRHEWIHFYLWAAGKRFFGDPFHRDPLFEKCEYYHFLSTDLE